MRCLWVLLELYQHIGDIWKSSFSFYSVFPPQLPSLHRVLWAKFWTCVHTGVFSPLWYEYGTWLARYNGQTFFYVILIIVIDTEPISLFRKWKKKLESIVLSWYKVTFSPIRLLYVSMSCENFQLMQPEALGLPCR